MIRRPPRSTPLYSSAASDVYKRQDPAGPFLQPDGQLMKRLVPYRDPRGVGLAVPLFGGEADPTREATLGRHGDRVVPRLHDQTDDGALAPVSDRDGTQEGHGVSR